MRLLGVDGGLAHMGIAGLERRSDGTLHLIGGEVVETVPSNKKLGVRKGDDNMRRAKEVAARLSDALTFYDPAVLVYEAQSFGMKGQIAARQAGTAFGVIAGVSQVRGLPMLCVTPGDVKKAMCPQIPKGATKEDVILAVERRFPSVPWPSKKSVWEHLADAIGTVVAAQRDEMVLSMARMEAQSQERWMKQEKVARAVLEQQGGLRPAKP